MIGGSLVAEGITDFRIAVKHPAAVFLVFNQSPYLFKKFFRRTVILNQLPEDRLVHNKIPEADIFYLDYVSGYKVSQSAAYVSHHLRRPEQDGLQGCRTRVHHGRLRMPDYRLGLAENNPDVIPDNVVAFVHVRLVVIHGPCRCTGYDELIVFVLRH